MQFASFNGFKNYDQPFAFNTPYTGLAEIIGEGNVTSIMSPDGSVQLVFQPTVQWRRPFLNNNAGCFQNPNTNYFGAWFVRTVFNPIQLNTVFGEPRQPPTYGLQYLRTSNPDCSFTAPQTAYELKFHNDICTSTTDIHYFYPILRQCDWFQNSRGCGTPAATNTSCHYEVICSKPCNCCNSQEAKTERGCHIKSDSSMSCDESISANNTCSWKKGHEKKPRKLKKTKCECKKCRSRNSDKAVTTYADQASGSTQRKGYMTQTACNGIPVRKAKSRQFGRKQVIESELWRAKTPVSKKAMQSKSSTSCAICESGCSSACCSFSDTC